MTVAILANSAELKPIGFKAVAKIGRFFAPRISLTPLIPKRGPLKEFKKSSGKSIFVTLTSGNIETFPQTTFNI